MTRLAVGDLLTVPQVLQILPIGKSTLYALIDNGEIPAVRVGANTGRRGRILIHRDDLDEYVARSRQRRPSAPVRVDVDNLLKKIRRNGGSHA